MPDDLLSSILSEATLGAIAWVLARLFPVAS